MDPPERAGPDHLRQFTVSVDLPETRTRATPSCPPGRVLTPIVCTVHRFPAGLHVLEVWKRFVSSGSVILFLKHIAAPLLSFLAPCPSSPQFSVFYSLVLAVSLSLINAMNWLSFGC